MVHAIITGLPPLHGSLAIGYRPPGCYNVRQNPKSYRYQHSSFSLPFFVYDKTQGGVRRYDINSESENPNLLHLKLFPGSYTGFCVTGAEEAESWEYAENSSPEEIYLKSQKTAKGNEEAGDHLLGTTDFEVTEEGGQVVFDLSRKVAMIKVIITNIPEWLTDLQINPFRGGTKNEPHRKVYRNLYHF